MQTMTANEYLQYALLKAVTRLAERDGITIIAVDEKPWPRLVAGTVVNLRAQKEPER